MTSRRKARTAAARAATGMPPEVQDQQHPLWRNLIDLKAHPVFAPYVDDATTQRLRTGGRAYHHIVGRWLLDNGMESESHRGTPDWRALTRQETE